MLGIAKLSFSIVLLVLAFLSQVPLFSFDFSNAQFIPFYYSPALIVVFVLSMAFRNNYALIALVSILVAVLCGLPLFSFGGGWQYIMQPSFGFIIAMIFMAITVFYHNYHSEDKDNSFTNSLVSLVLANVFGIVYFILSRKLEFIPVGIFVSQFIFDLLFAIISLWLFKKQQEIIN